nr:MAG TPA: TerB N-terminal domain [Caudoviricetes sp.]
MLQVFGCNWIFNYSAAAPCRKFSETIGSILQRRGVTGYLFLYFYEVIA